MITCEAIRYSGGTETEPLTVSQRISGAAEEIMEIKERLRRQGELLAADGIVVACQPVEEANNSVIVSFSKHVPAEWFIQPDTFEMMERAGYNAERFKNALVAELRSITHQMPQAKVCDPLLEEARRRSHKTKPPEIY